MTIIGSKRKSVQYSRPTLFIFTFVACAAIVYIRYSLGKNSNSETRSLKNFPLISEKLTEEKCTEVCETEECLHHSKFLFNRMETFADPCENFFEFSCGKYAIKFKDETRNFVSEMTLDMQLILKNLLENLDADPESISGKIRTVYESCVKQSSSDLRAIPILLKYLSTFGIPNWPNLEPDFKFDNPSLIGVLGHFLSYREYGFIDISEKFVYQRMLQKQLNVTVSVMESTYEKKEKSIREYLLRRVLKYFNFDSDSINEMWEETESIHDAIMHLKQANESIYEEDDYPISVDCALESVAEWKFLCELVESFVNTAEINAEVTKRFIDIRRNSLYMQNVIPLLGNFSDKSVANYLALNLLFNHLDELTFYFRLTYEKDPDSFSEYLRMPLQMENSQHCIAWLVKNMHVPVSHLYLQKVFKPDTVEEVSGLMKEIQKETTDAILNQEWLTEEERIKYGQEIENIENDFNFIARILFNETFINGLYQQFQPTDACFLQNVLENNRFSKAEQMRRSHFLAGLFEYDSFLKAAALGGKGSIDIKLGIWLPPVYRSHFPRLSNVVSLAAIVAHELGHSFHHSSESDGAAKNYMDERILCIENQYSQFRFKSLEINMNGSKYIGENVADIIAVSIIDRFIERYTSEKDALSFPGFPYPLKQMLYINSVQIWCEAQTMKDEEHNYKHGVHSLGKFR